MSFRRVLAQEDLWVGEMCGLMVGRVPVVVMNVDGVLFALQDCCAHQRVKLSEGRLDGCTLTCAAHGWIYDATTGCGINPGDVRVSRFPVRVEHGEVLVDVEAGA
jgi:toluene monooxygenase system ferredoxin subunit